MMPRLMGVLACATCLFAASTKDREAVEGRLDTATAVFSEIMDTPDHGIPRDLLNKSHCIVIVPSVKKAAFVVGGEYGKGFMSCRRKSDRGWSAPAAIRMEGGSFGFQIGGSATDVVMLVMNDRGAERLMGSQFTLGGEGEIAAGPVGRDTTAQTDAALTAEILSWSRAKGVFAGISLKGATLRQDMDDNAALYGEKVGTREVVSPENRKDRVTLTPAGRKLIAALDKVSPVKG